MELDKIADGLTKSAAASRTLGPIVKPGQYADWAGDLKKVAEDHYSKLQAEKTAAPTTDQPTGEGGNFLTNTFNTLKENYNNLDPALQNTIAGAGIGLGGGALAGLGSNLFSGRKKKNYLGDMMSMGLLGGLGGAGAGGLYSLATDPGVIERGAKALGVSTTPASAPPAPAAAATPSEDPNTPQGRANLLDKKLNATGLDAYTTDKAKKDLQTAGYITGGLAATGAAGRVLDRSAGDPTRIKIDGKALAEQAAKNNPITPPGPLAPGTTVEPSVKQMKAVIANGSAADIQKHLGYTVGSNGKITLTPDSPLLRATGQDRAKAVDLARQAETGPLASRRSFAQKIITPRGGLSSFFLGSNKVPLSDAGLTTEAQKAYRQANPGLRSLKRLGGGGVKGGLIGAGISLLPTAYSIYNANTSDSDRGKILSEQISNLLGSNTVTNPAQLQSLQGMANAAAQGLTPAQADYINKELTKIYQAP